MAKKPQDDDEKFVRDYIKSHARVHKGLAADAEERGDREAAIRHEHYADSTVKRLQRDR